MSTEEKKDLIRRKLATPEGRRQLTTAMRNISRSGLDDKDGRLVPATPNGRRRSTWIADTSV